MVFAHVRVAEAAEPPVVSAGHGQVHGILCVSSGLNPIYGYRAFDDCPSLDAASRARIAALEVVELELY